ncbi:uncharacterized protein EAF01_007773 [Botrytis porri]|uniref:Uncharacterized protein n=1 Tax=Botrytis porri TaxID=87229 RepID=A0A4Z1L5Y7_9HELO|nr:uncharacterized protein EAF01_007773 [Botrytis porri]KAF7900471.1 hypothetical protein EAF01_007773 [Botrytis porri]TGO92128.1 hypothetical protein BPOR_0009g00070 [Botrytis porri]
MYAYLGLVFTLTPVFMLLLIMIIGRILNRKRFSHADTYDLEARSSASEKEDEVTSNSRFTTTTISTMAPLRPARAVLAPERIQ